MEISPKIFKAYDIRGAYPDEINREAAYSIGLALAVYFEKEEAVVVGYDMRESSEALFQALSEGLTDGGKDVISIGLAGTEVLYFAVGKYEIPGVMITASHLGGEYNGMKICRSNNVPLGGGSGLDEIKQIIENQDFKKADRKGEIKTENILNRYVDHVLDFIDVSKIKPLKLVADAGNGMAGKVLPLVLEKLPCRAVSMYFNLDSDFPNHEPDPLVKENLKDLQTKVKEVSADLGVAFDGDGDRVFFIDENSGVVSGSLSLALFAKKILEKHSGEKVIYNAVCGRIVPETIRQNGGEPICEKVGHAFIKDRMNRTDAVLAGEHSGHYYFRHNFKADSGILALLLMLEIISEKQKPLSEILEPYLKYASISETNFEVDDKTKTLQKIEELYSDGEISHLDGLTVNYSDWWFNLRPSNTEPVLRLNMEAEGEELLEEKFEEIRGVIKNH